MYKAIQKTKITLNLKRMRAIIQLKPNLVYKITSINRKIRLKTRKIIFSRLTIMNLI